MSKIEYRQIPQSVPTRITTPIFDSNSPELMLLSTHLHPNHKLYLQPVYSVYKGENLKTFYTNFTEIDFDDLANESLKNCEYVYTTRDASRLVSQIWGEYRMHLRTVKTNSVSHPITYYTVIEEDMDKNVMARAIVKIDGEKGTFIGFNPTYLQRISFTNSRINKDINPNKLYNIQYFKNCMYPKENGFE